MTTNEELVKNLINAVRTQVNDEQKGRPNDANDESVETCRLAVIAMMSEETEIVSDARSEKIIIKYYITFHIINVSFC